MKDLSAILIVLTVEDVEDLRTGAGWEQTIDQILIEYVKN